MICSQYLGRNFKWTGKMQINNNRTLKYGCGSKKYLLKIYFRSKLKVINETVVEGRKFRRIVDPVTRNWIRTDPAWIAEKYRMNSLRKFKPMDKSKITFRKKTAMEDFLIITEFYKDFEGRIITTESIICDDTE